MSKNKNGHRIDYHHSGQLSGIFFFGNSINTVTRQNRLTNQNQRIRKHNGKKENAKKDEKKTPQQIRNCKSKSNQATPNQKTQQEITKTQQQIKKCMNRN